MNITTSTQTFVTITLSEDEARAALSDPTDLQIGIRAKLYMATGITLEKSAKAIAVRRNGREPRRGKTEPVAIPKGHRGKSLKRIECPHCHEFKSPQGFNRHVARCEREHASAVDEITRTND